MRTAGRPSGGSPRFGDPSPTKVARAKVKSASERATGSYSKSVAMKANGAFRAMAEQVDGFPALKRLVRTHIVGLGATTVDMIDTLQGLDTEVARQGEEIRALQRAMQNMQSSTQRAMHDMQRQTSKQFAVARLRVVTDELERHAVATALRQLRRSPRLRKSCTFAAANGDAALLAEANAVHTSWLPVGDPQAVERVRDARTSSSTEAHYALGDDVTVLALLRMNKLAKGIHHMNGWPAISSLQTMRESRPIVPAREDEPLLEADDPMFTLESLTDAERAEYNRRHQKWHRGCTHSI